MRKYLLLLASFAAPFAVCPNAFADSSCDAVVGNLLANCGFETGDFTSWTRIDPSNFTGVDSHNPFTGTYAANLGAEGTQGFLSQTVATVPGSFYDLSFFLENESATDDSGSPIPVSNMFSVAVTDDLGQTTTLASTDNIADSSSYASYQYFFFGSGTDTVSFIYQNDPSYFDLDDIILVDPPAPGASPVPEPSSLVLLGSGILGCAGVLRGRFRTKRISPSVVSGSI
jgi:hypothetical protein